MSEMSEEKAKPKEEIIPQYLICPRCETIFTLREHKDKFNKVIIYISLWWNYLFRKRVGIKTFWCRLRGHPHGITWNYSEDSNELREPKIKCINCGDDLWL